MRGPGLQTISKLRRTWKCPVCGYERHLPGDRTSVRCQCSGEPFMKLHTEPRFARPLNRWVDPYVNADDVLGPPEAAPPANPDLANPDLANEVTTNEFTTNEITSDDFGTGAVTPVSAASSPQDVSEATRHPGDDAPASASLSDREAAAMPGEAPESAAAMQSVAPPSAEAVDAPRIAADSEAEPPGRPQRGPNRQRRRQRGGRPPGPPAGSSGKPAGS
mgnify:CR=1 FL=1